MHKTDNIENMHKMSIVFVQFEQCSSRTVCRSSQRKFSQKHPDHTGILKAAT